MKQNDILKIGTFSILCYLILRVSHYILIKLLLLLNLKFQIENEIMLLTLSGIITGILPIIILIISINKSILKSTLPNFKIIFSLFIGLIVLTFIREGIDIYRNQFMSISELGSFKEAYFNQLSWSIAFFLFVSIALLIFYLIKLGSLEKQNLEKESGILKVGISSVLCYLVFEKVYIILTSILTWIYTLLKIENEFIILGINVLFGFLSILILISIYNRIIKNKIPTKKNIYILFLIGILLVFLVSGNSFLVSEYLVDKTELEFSNYKFLSQFNWTTELNYLVRFLGLSYFIWKLYSERKTVANNVYN
ncbi:hypothetical protein DFQ09_1127 [Winogradskyella pacifica]|uniref:Uncharacterized protein n=1 Tax=Winogradskyella pacifica TaxID=664642 RepID=A0A3D9LLM2_9FLAO|nr:hypothetical protein [Winogradskyella pacifica]REE07660.1 hypothetical protein DFQ09_1127 [Winogradskyella pacifica]